MFIDPAIFISKKFFNRFPWFYSASYVCFLICLEYIERKAFDGNAAGHGVGRVAVSWRNNDAWPSSVLHVCVYVSRG